MPMQAEWFLDCNYSQAKHFHATNMKEMFWLSGKSGPSKPRWLLLLALLLVTIRIIASLLLRHTQLFQLYPHVVWECSPLMAQSHGELSEQCTFLKNITRKKVCSVTGLFWKYDNICVTDGRWPSRNTQEPL